MLPDSLAAVPGLHRSAESSHAVLKIHSGRPTAGRFLRVACPNTGSLPAQLERSDGLLDQTHTFARSGHTCLGGRNNGMKLGVPYWR